MSWKDLRRFIDLVWSLMRLLSTLEKSGELFSVYRIESDAEMSLKQPKSGADTNTTSRYRRPVLREIKMRNNGRVAAPFKFRSPSPNQPFCK